MEFTLKELTIDGKGTYGIAAPAVDYAPNKYTYLRITDINDDGSLNFQGLKSVDDDDAEKYLLKENDIVFARTGASTGRTYFYEKHHGEFVYAGFLIKYSLDPQKVNPKLLKYYTHSKVYYDWVHSFDTGGTRGNINAKAFADMKMQLPEREAQDKIVNILSSLDRKIELNNKINATLEEMAQALFKSWFVDFEPFKNGNFIDTEIGKIPEGWRVGTLSEVAEINPKRTLKKGEEGTYLDMKNMPTSGSFPSQWERRSMNGGMKFKNGDTLMARITPCLENGKVAYVNFLEDEEVGFGSTEYIVITSKSGLLPEIFYTLCRYPDFVAYATRNMNGSSGRQRVSGEVIGNYKIAIPPVDVVKHLQPLFASIMKQIREHGFENRALTHLRDTLLPRLMLGEIEV